MFFEGLIPVNTAKVEITNAIPDPNKQLLGAKDYHQVIYKEVGEVQTYRDTQIALRGLSKNVSNLNNTVVEQGQQITRTQLNQQVTQQQLTSAQQQLSQTQQQLTETQKKLASGGK
jgi:peptidoglycan hydrolase CwlO-like protein